MVGVAQGAWKLVLALHSHLSLAGGPCTDPALHLVDLPVWRVHPLRASAHLA